MKRADLLARDTFLERVAEGLAGRVRKLEAALVRAELREDAREALAELAGFSRELGLIAVPGAAVERTRSGAVDLAAAVRGLIQRHRDKVGADGRDLRLDLEEGVVVACTPDDVELVLCELLSNAAKYGAGAIEIGASRSGARARLTIRDGGRGISAAERRRVLGRFVRGTGARPRTGYGVGLWLVRKVARGYGGDLKLLPRATFEVTLPLASGGPTRPGGASGTT